MTLLVGFIVAAVVVTGIFLVIFARDAKRADRVSEDTERLDPAPEDPSHRSPE